MKARKDGRGEVDVPHEIVDAGLGGSHSGGGGMEVSVLGGGYV